MTENQPRYTTKRLHDEIAKAKAYARCEALQEAAGVAYRTCAETRHVTLGDKAREAILALVSNPAPETHVAGDDPHAQSLLGAQNNVIDGLMAENEKLRSGLSKINDIRNSIIGCQKMNWSEHIYPLVAALNEAGIEGQHYPESREYVGTMLERTLAAENQADGLRAALKLAIDHIEHMAAHFSNRGTGYSFESLGEDMPGIKAALATTEGSTE
jgi:hypothetical protein